MKPFQTARIKLTGWYLLIIMGISISFSIFVYRQFMQEVRRGVHLHVERMLIPFNLDPSITPFAIENSLYEEVQHRILLELLAINGGIGLFSAIAGYFLAGKTLHPIEEMLEEQKRFTADASHELRTPLTSMKTEIEVALRAEKLNSDEARNLLKSNLEEVDKMQQLTNYLLTLHRYHDKNVQLSFEETHLNELIQEAKNRTSLLAQEKHIEIINKGKDITIRANSMSLTEVLTILLDNAIKYSHPKSEVIIKTKILKKNAQIIVEDKGIGIKESELPYIFNRFYRADSSRSKTQIAGYGLGLSIAKNIIDLHKGKIEVESQSEKGSQFIITLPML